MNVRALFQSLQQAFGRARPDYEYFRADGRVHRRDAHSGDAEHFGIQGWAAPPSSAAAAGTTSPPPLRPHRNGDLS